jgi:hypothetical protein
MPYPLEHLAGATSRGQTMTPEGQKPAQCSTLRNSQERCTHNPLCTKHFHGVLSARPHVYSLQSRYGKVRGQLIPPMSRVPITRENNKENNSYKPPVKQVTESTGRWKTKPHKHERRYDMSTFMRNLLSTKRLQGGTVF